jgi:hypothetical protein
MEMPFSNCDSSDMMNKLEIMKRLAAYFSTLQEICSKSRFILSSQFIVVLAVKLQLSNEHVTSLAMDIFSATEKKGVSLIGIEKQITKRKIRQQGYNLRILRRV